MKTNNDLNFTFFDYFRIKYGKNTVKRRKIISLANNQTYVVDISLLSGFVSSDILRPYRIIQIVKKDKKNSVNYKVIPPNILLTWKNLPVIK